MIKKIFISAILLCVVHGIFAQQKSRYNFFSYSVNEGLLQSTVFDLAIDQNNFCWLSFSNGIQRFDGNSFKIIPIQPGLPDDKNVILYRQQNGTLIFIHSQGISRYNVNKNNFDQVFSLPAAGHYKLSLIGERNNIIYLYGADATMLALNASTYKILFTEAMPFILPVSGSAIPVFSNIENNKVNICLRQKLYLYDLEKRKLLKQSPVLPDLYKNFIAANASNEVICFTEQGVWQLSSYNYDEDRFTPLFKTKEGSLGFRGMLYNWDGKKVISYYNKLLLMSSDLKTDSAELVDFKNYGIAGNVNILKMVADNFGNLYIVTINDGIRKIIRNSYPLRYYGIPGNKKNYTLCIYPDKKANRVLSGTFHNGIVIFDSLQNLVKHIEHLPGETESFSATNIIRNNKGEYIFIAMGKPNPYKLSADLSNITALPIEESSKGSFPDVSYFSNLVYDGPQNAILQTETKFYVINKNTNRIRLYRINQAATHGGLLYNGKLIVHNDDQIREYDTAAFKEIRSIAFPNTSGVRCYAALGNKLYFGSNKGIFITDDKYNIIRQYNRTTGLPDECIYAMQFDEKNNLWCSTNKGIFRISPSGNLFQLTKDDGLQENEFNNNASYKSADGELFFGGINGINSFYPAAIPNYMVDVGIYFTNIKVNNKDYEADTALQYLHKIVLPYNQNSIELSFIASGPQNAHRYIHQYKMEGMDKQWLQQPAGEPVRYVLQPGKYVFKMYAASSFDNNAVPLKEILVIINPPFWKTWWFLSLLALCIIGLIIYFINRYNKARYQKRLNILLTQQKVREERERISMELHDSIGAYANAVLYNTELLQHEKEETGREQLMKDLRFASKDIITSLRETIWALKNENYTAQECLMRIRNFIHPFSRYYSGINFKIEGDAPEAKELHYGLALNVVRIVQESVNNAIKHSNPQNVLIKSSTDADGGWQLDIYDDGRGFDSNRINAGNGLINMKKRAAEWNFTINIESEPGKGTHISMLVPA